MTLDRTIADIDRDLAQVDYLLAQVRQDLSRCPDHKKGTRWHDDRIAARRQLKAKRDALEIERLAAVQASNPE